MSCFPAGTTAAEIPAASGQDKNVQQRGSKRTGCQNTTPCWGLGGIWKESIRLHNTEYCDNNNALTDLLLALHIKSKHCAPGAIDSPCSASLVEAKVSCIIILKGTCMMTRQDVCFYLLNCFICKSRFCPSSSVSERSVLDTVLMDNPLCWLHPVLWSLCLLLVVKSFQTHPTYVAGGTWNSGVAARILTACEAEHSYESGCEQK